MLNIIGLPTALHIVQEDPRSRELGTVQNKIAVKLQSMIANKEHF